MKNIDITTGEIIDIEDFDTPQTKEETKELTNREVQFQRLLAASAEAKTIKAALMNNANSLEQALYYQYLPLNYYILNYVYAGEGITDFKKFNAWKSEGATIRKGEKAFPIWGQPVGRQKEESAEQKGEKYEATDEEKQRFPMCYVFSNLQVSFKNQPQTVEV